MKNVLVSGAGIAGPALALCLNRLGIATTVVERAPALRDGGQAVDFRGPIHRDVLERLELWDAIHERRTRPLALVLLGRAGKPCATLPELMMSGDVEILRGDLSRLLHDRTHPTTEYRFGDRITALDDHGDGVTVEFERGARATYDLVVGADGLHSGVRALAFGDERSILRHHGYRIATFAMPDAKLEHHTAVLQTEPGRALMVSPSKEQPRALFVHAAPPLGEDRRNLAAQRRALRERYAGMGGSVPTALDALDRAEDLYVDAIATVHVPRYSRGRVVLLGDAAWGGTLGGQGTSLGIVGAYVLAGELAREADPNVALARYEAEMRPYATGCQKGARHAGPFFAPKTALGLWLRNVMYRVLTSRVLIRRFERMVTDAATDFVLPEYGT